MSKKKKLSKADYEGILKTTATTFYILHSVHEALSDEAAKSALKPSMDFAFHEIMMAADKLDEVKATAILDAGQAAAALIIRKSNEVEAAV